MSIEKRVIRALTYSLGMPDGVVTINSTKKTLNMDSLDDVECIMEIEDEFNISITDKDAERLITVRQVVDYVAQFQLKTE